MSNVTLPTISKRGHELFARAAAAFGAKHRLAQAASEHAELSAELTRALTGRSNRKEIIMESAHALMMLAQLGHVLPGFYQDLSRALASEMRRFQIAVEAKERELLEDAKRIEVIESVRAKMAPPPRPGLVARLLRAAECL